MLTSEFPCNEFPSNRLAILAFGRARHFACCLCLAATLHGWLAHILFLMVSTAVYALGYCLELSSIDLSSALFWNRFQYIGILTFTTLYLIFVIEYTGKRAWLTSRRSALLFALPLTFFVIKLLDGSLHWIYASVDFTIVNSVFLLTFQRGPVYLLIAAFQLIIVTIANGLLIRKWAFSSSLYKRQTSIMLVAAIIPYLAYIAYLLNVELHDSLHGIDFNPLAYAVWALAIGYAAFRFRFLDLAPVARETLIEMLGDGVLVLDAEGRLVDANPKAQTIFGWQSAPFGSPVDKYLGETITVRQLSAMQGSSKKEFSRDSQAYEITISVLEESAGSKLGFLLVLHDVTQQKAVENELQELSLHDELTGLNNRRGFNVLSAQMLSVANRVEMDAALFYIDVDGLKGVNDSLGHAMGDQVIIDMANILKNSFRASDIIARFGGDEFVALAFESDVNSTEMMQSRLAQAAQANEKLDRPYRLVFSVGVAHYRWQAPQLLAAVLAEADRAMYEVKLAKKREQTIA